jgi:hypothetical protein
MNREGHSNVKFFIGPEVEHTPAFSKKTLFVVGKQPLSDIEDLATKYKTTHIFLGANHSFNAASEDPYWDTVITALLDKGFWVTLDYQAHEHEKVLKMLNAGIWQCRTFVPLLGVRIPKIQTSSINLTVKIDDIDFNATNPGVWCLHHHELTDSNRFTDWNEYGTDQVLTSDPVYAEVNRPEIKLEKLKEVVVKKEQESVENVDCSETVVNNTELGLDTEEKKSPVEDTPHVPSTPDAAAEAYAGDVKEDPLGKEPSKKAKAKK